MKRHGAVILAVPTLAILTATAVADPFRPSLADQIKLGQRAAAELEKESKILPESDWRSREFRELGNGLVDVLYRGQKNPFQYTFKVVDDKALNAFALPGGPIYINSGLLDKLQTKDQVAGILAHEIIHVHKQHWASAYADSQKRSLGIIALLTIFRAGKTAYDVAGITNAVVFDLPYSRRHETEADNLGYNLAVQSGWNPQGLVDVFKVLKQASGGRSGGPEWASTHPDTDRRIRNLEERIRKERTTFPAQRSRSQLSPNATERIPQGA
ncbi:MAG: M48 family metallopeptidase [Fimbriimonadaceae bacterium]|nr:M48 family metallopeptidase [Fimbriimonadaceae bacterium]